MRIVATRLGYLVAVAAVAASMQAQPFNASVGGDLTIPSGEVREGDTYVAAESFRVHGRIDGDLVAAANRIVVDGSVVGDVFAVAQKVDLLGPVGDSTRVVAQTLTVDAAIDGDLVALGRDLVTTASARIGGRFAGMAARMDVDGTVDNGVDLAAGEILVRGTVLGDATMKADRIELAPGARIAGDLHYEARNPLDAEAAARVDGTLHFSERVDESAEGGMPWRILLWFGQMLAALVAGIGFVAVFRGFVRRLAETLAAEATLSVLLGFAAFLLVPVVAAAAMLTLVGLPLGLAAALLFAVALYAAKLPIASWIGGWLLERAGRPSASPYAAMALGVVLLYLLFAVPYVGWLLWFGSSWLGLGALVVCFRRHLELRSGTP